MSGERGKGLSYSAALHLLILCFIVFGLPSFMEKKAPPPMVIAVDILPISEMTNVKASDQPLAKEEKPEPPKKEEKPPTPPVKQDTPPPPPPETKPEPLPDAKKEEKKPEKPEEKKAEPKKEEKQKKAKENDLDAVLKSLREEAKKEKQNDQAKDKKPTDSGTKAKAKDAPYDPGKPMSMSELDAIRSQIAKCWSVPAGAKDAHELQVTLRVQLSEDGTVLLVELADESKARYGADTFYRAAADSAMRAVRQCSPLKNLPADKYQTWRDMLMTFDPKEMLF